jgi:TM2 domain-containing membrane protein YozV
MSGGAAAGAPRTSDAAAAATNGGTGSPAHAASAGPHTSKAIAYLLFFTTGLLGTHLFYVGRYAQGFLSLHTVGFGFVGLLYDLVCLGRYVDEANGDQGRGEAAAGSGRGVGVGWGLGVGGRELGSSHQPMPSSSIGTLSVCTTPR